MGEVQKGRKEILPVVEDGMENMTKAEKAGLDRFYNRTEAEVRAEVEAEAKAFAKAKAKAKDEATKAKLSN